MKFLLFFLFIPSAGLIAQPTNPAEIDSSRTDPLSPRQNGGSGGPRAIASKPDFPSKEWKAAQEAAIAEAKQSKEPQKAIELLSQVLLDTPDLGGGICGNVSAEMLKQFRLDAALAEEMGVEAAKVLAGIPGHADYQKIRIVEAAARFDPTKYPYEQQKARDLFVREQRRILYVLGRVRSVESVRVLGELLVDKSDRAVVAFRGKLEIEKISTNSQLVPAALACLQLRWQASKEGAFVSWEDWYDEMRAGTRRFSFDGNPRIYNLGGPVSEERSPVTRDAR